MTANEPGVGNKNRISLEVRFNGTIVDRVELFSYKKRRR